MRSKALLVACAVGASVIGVGGADAATPLFPNSVASNDLDFILGTDRNAFTSYSYETFGRRELPGKDDLFGNAYIFRTNHRGSGPVEIWAHEDFGSRTAAEPYVLHLANALGKLPAIIREAVGHVVLHVGNRTAFAQEDQFFVTYSQNIDTRVSNNDLEETVFHESIHVALESEHSRSPEWLAAQAADPAFITDYAESRPLQEDLPESALFAYALINYPGRLPAEIEEAIQTLMPNRLEYIRQIPGIDLGGGDYNNDGRIDAADYTVWRDRFGAEAGALPNDLAGGPIGPGQYATWESRFGSIVGGNAGNTQAIPEPSMIALFLSSAFLLTCGRRRPMDG